MWVSSKIACQNWDHRRVTPLRRSRIVKDNWALSSLRCATAEIWILALLQLCWRAQRKICNFACFVYNWIKFSSQQSSFTLFCMYFFVTWKPCNIFSPCAPTLSSLASTINRHANKEGHRNHQRDKIPPKQSLTRRWNAHHQPDTPCVPMWHRLVLIYIGQFKSNFHEHE